MSQGYVSAIGDPYAQAALSSPNYNQQIQLLAYKKMLEQQTAVPDATRVDNTSAYLSSQYGNNNTSFKAKPKEKSSNTGLYVAGALAAAAYAGYCIYTKQSPWQAAKTLFGKVKGIFTGKGANASETIKAIMGSDGKLTFTISGKTTNIPASEISAKAAEYGIDVKALQEILSGKTKVESGVFEFLDGGITNTVKFENGVIKEILNGKKENITKLLESTDAKDIDFITKLKDQVAKITKLEDGYDKIKGLKNLTFTNTIGDNTLKFEQLFKAAKGGKITTLINPLELTTLERFSQESDAVQAFFQRNGGKLSEIFTIKDGKLPSGLKIESFVHKYTGDGAQSVLIRNGQPVGVTKGGTFYDSTTDEFQAFLGRVKDNLKISVQNALKGNKIPEGAILVRA